MRRLRINLRLLWRRILREKGTPEAIGRGVAAGVIVGMTPFMGIQTPLAMFLAWVIRGNPLAAVPMVWISNPFTAAPLYFLEYEVGRLLLFWWERPGASGKLQEFIALLNGGTEGRGFVDSSLMLAKALLGTGAAVIVPLLVGGLVLGLVLALPSFFVTSKAVRAVRERRSRKRARYVHVTDVPEIVPGEHDDPVKE